MMTLWDWQQEAIDTALKKFEVPFTHFLCLATPGAGKTVMASTLADILIKKGKVDLVLCFSPSKVVARDFKNELEAITQRRFCGGLGATGSSLTYQSMRYLDDAFWKLLDSERVFVIFDEIHHCAGNAFENANAWGAEILKHIQGKAHYTIALTGTPWRSDTVPIVLANYVGQKNHIHVDYRYDLKQANNDGICRTPHLTMVDNELISVLEDNEKTSYRSITEFLEHSSLPYSEIIGHDEVIRQILKRGIAQLSTERAIASDAGGLIVAASISHAKRIQSLLSELGETSELVTYQENESESLIHHFKHSTKKWVISISMISEGTNIPRLRVCCFLSLVTTELYFRQVLGRVLRAQYTKKEVGYFISPAHPRLLEFANRVYEEIPHCAAINSSGIQVVSNSETVNSVTLENSSTGDKKPRKSTSPVNLEVAEEHLSGLLPTWYNSTIDSFGRFHHKVFML